jgi:hypothetical protein
MSRRQSEIQLLEKTWLSTRRGRALDMVRFVVELLQYLALVMKINLRLSD